MGIDSRSEVVFSCDMDNKEKWGIQHLNYKMYFISVSAALRSGRRGGFFPHIFFYNVYFELEKLINL